MIKSLPAACRKTIGLTEATVVKKQRGYCANADFTRNPERQNTHRHCEARSNPAYTWAVTKHQIASYLAMTAGNFFFVIAVSIP